MVIWPSDLEELAAIVDPPSMKKGRKAFIEKHKWWVDAP
jgi:hypothetical protein